MNGFILKAAALGLLLAACIMLWPQKSHADNAQPSVFASVNSTWLQGPDIAFPVDLELGANAKASLSPHFSAVGGLFGGLTHSYLRYQGGVRLTTTDVSNPKFNTFIGLLYRGGSITALGPAELAPDAGFGWRPFDSLPQLIVGAEASVGYTSSLTIASLGARYQFPLK